MTHRIGFTGYPVGGAERYYEYCLDKYDATVAPTTSNNASEGYSVGSRWFDIVAVKAYLLIAFSGTSATWIEISPSLAGYVPTSRTVTGTKSVSGGGDLSANRTLELVNDEASPGNSKYYGTNPSGTKGYHALTTGAAWGGITGTLSSQTDLQTALDAKQPLDADLTAIAALAGVGGAFKTSNSPDTWQLRVITGTTGQISVANGSGVGGNPTLTLVDVGAAGTYGIVTTDAKGRVTSGASHTVSLSELSSGNYTIASSGSWLDTGCSITLGPGTWLISGSVSGFIALTTGRYQIKARIATSGGTLVAGTETIFMDNGITTIVVANGTLAQAEVAGSATYKIQVWRTEFVAGTGVSTGIYGNSDGTRLSAIRIA